MGDLIYKIDENLTIPIQETLLSVGVDTWWKTGLVFSGVTYLGIRAFKPQSFYNADGSERPWNVGLDPTSSKMSGATPVPAWLASVSIGFILSSFI